MTRIRRGSWVVLGAFVVAALAFGTIAAASGDRAPTTEPLRGTYTLSAVDITTRTCAGTDGAYVEARGSLVGTSRSTDPRFNGKFEAFIDRGLINLTTGYGTSRGHVAWSDASGKETARAAYREVITESSHATGIFFGRVAAADGLPAGELFANYKAAFDSHLNATAEYGAAGDSQTPAVVQSGGCGSDEEGDD
jgi:hypothetical protein